MAWFHDTTLPPFLEKKPFWRRARILQNGYLPQGFAGKEIWVINIPPLIETEGHNPFQAQDAFEREATPPASVYITNLEDALFAKERIMKVQNGKPWERPRTFKAHVGACVHIEQSAIQLLDEYKWKPWEVPWVTAENWLRVGAASLPRRFGTGFRPDSPLLNGTH